MSLTPCERWLSILKGEKPDRIPTDIWATPEVEKRLLEELSCSNREELLNTLHIDGCNWAVPQRTVLHHPDNPDADIWGLQWTTIDYGTGSYSEATTHPLAQIQTVEEVHSFKWPNPDDIDWDGFKNTIKNFPQNRIVCNGNYEPFMLYCHMRGMEQAMMDLLCETEIAEAILGHIFDYHFGVNQRAWEIGRGKIHMTYIAEDLGSQSSLLIGIEQIRQHILPNQKKMADLARSFGLFIFYHSDGAAREVIPDLIDITGINILNPIQWRCAGMERDGLVRDFGKQIVFHGAVDNQQTLPFGTIRDVEQEVLDNIRLFSPARWICAPCHFIQPVTPTANILKMYETVWNNGML
jgi:uroporphyrinogen decarboxylase